MSKIGADKMKAAIHEMLTADHKQRKFKETIDLQIGLKDYKKLIKFIYKF